MKHGKFFTMLNFSDNMNQPDMNKNNYS